MILWCLFYILELLLVALAQKTTHLHSKKTLYSVSALIAIYFSAFRNGLGTDYKGYIEQLESSYTFSSEPLYNLIKNIVLETNLSPVFFFAFCATVTVWFFWKYLDNKNNEFASLSIIIFLSLPGLYFNTFNVIRQYFSAAVFLYSLKFIQSKQLIRYTLCITVACTMHVSAIILFPLYFVLNKKINFRHYITIAVVLLIIALSMDPVINGIPLISNKYSVYLDHEINAGKSTITFLCLLILIIYFLKFKQSADKTTVRESPYIVITINMFALYTIFSLLTYVNFFFYRVAFYFGASICIMIPFVLYQIFNNRTSVIIVCLLFSFAYFFSFIAMGKDNVEICSEKMLPISSMFDISPI